MILRIRWILKMFDTIFFQMHLFFTHSKNYTSLFFGGNGPLSHFTYMCCQVRHWQQNPLCNLINVLAMRPVFFPGPELVVLKTRAQLIHMSMVCFLLTIRRHLTTKEPRFTPIILNYYVF